MKDFFAKIGEYFMDNWGVIVRFLAVLIIGFILIRVVLFFFNKGRKRTKLDNAAGNFLHTVIKIVMYVVYLMALLTLLGIPTTSLIALISTFGLAISLALQSTISNLASGFVIISSKPFVEGNYVEISGVSGTVKKITIFATKLNTPDNKEVTVPNSSVVNSNIINYSSQSTRRVDINFRIGLDTDLEAAKKIIRDTVCALSEVIEDPAPVIRLSEQSDSALTIVVKAWVPNAEYWNAIYNINEEILAAFKNNGIIIPHNQMDVHIVNNESELKVFEK